VIATAPLYLYTERTQAHEQATVRRVDEGVTVWTSPLSPGQSKTAALLALDSLFVNVCESNAVVGLCEVLRLNAATGELQSSTPGDLWKATSDYALVLKSLGRTVQALDFFAFTGRVFLWTGVVEVAGQVTARGRCGQLDVLGARYASQQVWLTLRDGCGLWRKSFSIPP
jgi:hypothetical protein